MPLPKAKGGASKSAKQKVVSKVIRKLASERPGMSSKQRIAIGLKQARLSKKH